MQGECKKLNTIFLIKPYNSTTEGLVKIIPTKRSLELADHSSRFGRNSPESELSVPAVLGLEKKLNELNIIVLLSHLLSMSRFSANYYIIWKKSITR